MASTRTRVPDSIKAYTKLGLRVYDWLVMHLFLKVDNSKDRLSDLRHELSTRFIDCRVEAIGCMALFSAVVPGAEQ